MTKRKKRVITVLTSVSAAIVIIIIVTLGVWFGANVIQKGLIRMMCKDAPSSTPENYDEILAATTLVTEEYSESLTLDRIEPKGLGDDAVGVLVFHGGYYVGGGRHNQEPFARLIASRGFRVFNIDYSLAPEKIYPAQIGEADKALSYIAGKYPDAKGFVVSGDSAGAHLAAQLCASVRDGGLRAELNPQSTVSADRLLGFVGSCGFYQATTVADTGFFLIGDALEMLTGVKDYKSLPSIKQLDIIDYAGSFPNTLLICGDKDPFISQNTAFRDALTKAGVGVETYFPVSGADELGHEFQCNYNLKESYTAADKIIGFLNTLG